MAVVTLLCVGVSLSSCGGPTVPSITSQINLGPKSAPISALSNDLGDWARAHRLAVEELALLVPQAGHITDKSLSTSCSKNYQCVYDSIASWCSEAQAQQRWVQGVPAPPTPQASNAWNDAEVSGVAANNNCQAAFNDGLASQDMLYRQSILSELNADESALVNLFDVAKINVKTLPRPSSSVCISGAGCFTPPGGQS
jgi:hypothetical protein